jgi:D-arabinose 1-dehydrogenase-like Zn-dependent alcohol dehydrogenase
LRALKSAILASAVLLRNLFQRIVVFGGVKEVPASSPTDASSSQRGSSNTAAVETSLANADSFSESGLPARMPSSSDKRIKSMKSFRRASTTEDFVVENDQPMPDLLPGGAIVKVFYAGACYTNAQVANSGQKRPRMLGVKDTSLFPGFEVSGVVEEIDPTVKTLVKPGDRVIVYPTEDQERTESGYSEYISVKDAHNLIPLPDGLALDVAAILPCGALAAYAAVLRVKPVVEERLKHTTGFLNVLIVGAGGLALWTLRLCGYHIAATGNRVRIIVADSSVDKLMIAKAHGCYDVVHWDESQHEEYLIMRTKNACKGGIDVAIDFVSTSRTVSRSMKILKDGGLLVVGGNSKYDVPIPLYTLALRSQSIIGVHHGTREQLIDLVRLVAEGQVQPPVYSVYPVDDANRVFRQLSNCRINGRAVLRVCSADESDSVFFSQSQNELRCNFSLPATMPESPEPPLSPTGSDEGQSSGAVGGGAFFLPTTY